MIRKRKYIKIFALTILFMISISVNAEVKAETNYYDENNVMYRQIFDDTQLKNFVKRDFALYYNEKDMQNNDIAKLTSQNGSYNYSMGFAKEKELNILIYETSETWQQSRNEKYIAIVLPDYYAGTGTSATIHENIKAVKNNDIGYLFKGDRYIKFISNIDYLNFNKNEYDRAILNNYLADYGGDVILIIAVDKEGNVSRKNNLYDNDKNLYNEIANSTSNLIYSSVDIYNESGTEIIKPKEDFETRKDIRVEKDIKVNTDESNIINFKIYNLKKDDRIKIIKKDKNGNYTESDIIERSITIDLNENQSYLIKDENIKENKIYDIKVYDSKSKIIYQEEYIHSMKNYVLEDKTEEKNKLINLEDYKINNKVANLIKNVFIIGNNEYLGKLIFLVFTITIITIIRKMV